MPLRVANEGVTTRARSLGVLRFALAERPVPPDDFDEIDEQVLRLEPWFLSEQLCGARKEIALLLRLPAPAQGDLHQNDVIGTVDAEIGRIVDEPARIVLGDDLEAVVLGHGERFYHGPMNAVPDRAAIIGGLAGEQ